MIQMQAAMVEGKLDVDGQLDGPGNPS